MEEQASQVSSGPTPETQALQELKFTARNMTAWLKLLGIINIIQGAFAAITIVGIVVAWLPIWLGVLLFQAGNRAQSAEFTNNPRELVQMMEKLRLYFIIQGIVFMVVLAMAVVGMLVMGTTLFGLMHEINFNKF